MTEQQLLQRTKVYALRVVRLTEALPKTTTTGIIGKQLLRSGTYVGANYRAARRAKSPAEFIAKMGIVEEEADETLYWMEMLIELGIVKESRLTELMRKGNEIVAMTVASIHTTKTRMGGNR